MYLVLLALFMVRTKEAVKMYPGLKGFVWAVMGASLLVWARTIFRLGETAEGVLGFASTREVFFGVLEFAPIVLAVLVLAWWHPGRCVEGRVKGESGKEGGYEMTV